jgi:hypothetical protein
LLNAEGSVGTQLTPAAFSGDLMAGGRASLEWFPGQSDGQFLGLDLGYAHESEGKGALSGTDNDAYGALRLVPLHFGGTSINLLGGGGYNLSPSCADGHFAAFGGAGVRVNLASYLALDAGAQYQVSSPKAAFREGWQFTLGVSVPLDGSFFGNGQSQSASQSGSDQGGAQQAAGDQGSGQAAGQSGGDNSLNLDKDSGQTAGAGGGAAGTGQAENAASSGSAGAGNAGANAAGPGASASGSSGTGAGQASAQSGAQGAGQSAAAGATQSAAQASPCGQAASPEVNGTAIAPAAGGQAGMDTYVVVKGDYLWKIAGDPAVFGDSRLWPLLLETNSAAIEDPNYLRPGMVLRFKSYYTDEEKAAARLKELNTPDQQPSLLREVEEHPY